MTRYASPGWLAAYALGLVGWCAIWSAWGYLVCLAVIGIGGLLAAAAAHALGADG